MPIKGFDSNIVAKYGGPRSPLSFGDRCELIGEEILKTNEHFEQVTKPDESFRGQPFDRLVMKQGKWVYIVEIKGGHHGFSGVPSHTQKRRMREVLEAVSEIEPVLLQFDLENAKYKVRYGQEIKALIADKGKKTSPNRQHNRLGQEEN